jgi:hypothetical protein
MSRLSDLVSNERSRKVEEPILAVHEAPIGMTTAKIGKRAVVVLAEAEPALTRRNSGEYCRKRDGKPTAAIDAGFIGLNGSKSAVAPPLPSARVLI